jgi:hypothetical protein
VPIGNIEVQHTFHVRFPTANMPSHEVGQINFSNDGKGYILLMPRDDFMRLGKKITQLLASKSPDDTPPG